MPKYKREEIIKRLELILKLNPYQAEKLMDILETILYEALDSHEQTHHDN